MLTSDIIHPMIAPAEQAAYTVRLPDFEGPLDLLLHLIEREELDITRVSLAQVTGNYMQYLAAMQRVEPEHIAEFLVVAAKLLYIKSRLLLPQDSTPGLAVEEDVGDELTRQLLEYRQYKQVATQLKEWDIKGLHAYPRIAPRPRVEPKLDLSHVSLDDLAALVEVVVAANRAAPIGDVVAPLVVRVSDMMEDIQQRLARGEHVSFRRWLGASRSRVEIVVSFLAVLELMKQRKIVVRQDELFGDIMIELAPIEAAPPSSATPNESDEPSFVEPTA
ncbi:MAG: segregation/condensation protein A [Chloroflexi bacterium]|nr:segregation/condensation protein A [Chloroflexota bacterium]